MIKKTAFLMNTYTIDYTLITITIVWLQNIQDVFELSTRLPR